MNPVRTIVHILLMLSLLVLPGCWDRKELNDIAIMLAFGVDLAKNGQYRGTAQFAVPSKLAPSEGGGTKENAFFTESGMGKTIYESTDFLQSKLSRSWFAGHRRASVFGEEMARHGLSELLDAYSRTPEIRMRSDMFVVKGGTAEQLLKLPYPLDRIPAIAYVKIHESLGVSSTLMMRDFLLAATSDGRSPILPALEILPGAKPKTESDGDGQSKDPDGKVKIAGSAVFNKSLKLVGYINNKESVTRRWIMGELRAANLTVPVPDEGTVVLRTSRLKSRVTPILSKDGVAFKVSLSGQGMIVENNTKLDLSLLKNVRKLEEALKKETEKQALQTIHHVQKQFKTDIFGFGDTVRRKHPYRWKTMKTRWQQIFPEAEMTVNADLKVKSVGLTGPPLMLEEDEIEK
ncbi:Ger(x)C family spore germination protein [Paenibacillus humicola]|uniref:Ger(x)C family spore germination protein n=1 Tax=Paenibacillus humicola TaxID=3110540 RepID=UPI00237B68E4|nr:Ger(x)C family spore germination protein [Paenibacillus humicola]